MADSLAAGAKLLADEAAVTNGRSCIQVHGGMGFTWEVPAHLAYKRARVLATQFGGVRGERAEVVGVGGQQPVEARGGRVVVAPPHATNVRAVFARACASRYGYA